MHDTEDTRGGEYVRSFERGLAVLRAFGPDHPHLTLSEVARLTDLPRAAVRRFLRTLIELGYVRTDGVTFTLRPKVLELGYWYLATLGLTEVATPHMEELAAQVNESCSMVVLDGDDIVYIVRVPVRRIMTITITVGTRLPAYATSAGQVLLAHLPKAELDAYLKRAHFTAFTEKTITDATRLREILARVREQGYGIVDEELEQGVRSLAVPVFDPDGQVRYSIVVSAHSSRATLDALAAQVPLLQATAEHISNDLRFVEGTTTA